MKKHFKRLIIFIILTVLILMKFSVSIKNLSSQDHINLITTNSIFAGFLFSGLSIMISIINTPRIKRLNDFGYLDSFFFGLYTGLVAHVLSILSSLGFIVVGGNLSDWFSRGTFLFLILGTLFFTKSVIRLISITQKARFE